MKTKLRGRLLALLLAAGLKAAMADDLEQEFVTPPDAARPWVYWYFMDGNMTREGLTADLEAMKAAGIGGAIFLEVNIGVPRGPVEFMSAPWRGLFAHAVHEAERLGIQIALGTGPGWCGSGGPWVKPEQSMQHLVASATNVAGPAHFDAVLPRPTPRVPFFGMASLTPEVKKLWEDYYRDEYVLAFPTPTGGAKIADVDEKALYFRAPFSSQPGVKPRLPMPRDFAALLPEQCIATNQLLDLTTQRDSSGRLVWDVPAGNWTILRFGRTITGQTTRPAPKPGLGLETDKFEQAALDDHFEKFITTLIKAAGTRTKPDAGLTTIHFDSWEMSSQNWSESFRAEFQKRRGYDPLPYLPAMLGRVVGRPEISERFLWDLRLTAQELVITNHAVRMKTLGRQHGLGLSIEPYDLNPTSDLELGGVADVPMCEFWSKGFGFTTEFSCIEATSIAHTLGRSIVGAESFTAAPGENWKQYPGSMKAQGDWALCCGINRFAFHRYQHQPWLDRFPGMTMGPYGVYWERTQTWWDMVSAYHTYLTRSQALLRRGAPVADILYLAAEGAPNVFQPPPSALLPGLFPDRRGYNFDGCAPSTLLEHARVENGRIVLPGTSYRVLVLPRVAAMTPAMLGKIKQLADAGATIIGAPPKYSPSLVNYPQCDAEVKKLAGELWGAGGRIILDSEVTTNLYPSYETTAALLAQHGLPPDFESTGDLRYIHRREGATEIYFVGNRTAQPLAAECRFRVAGKQPELWDPLTGTRRALPQFSERDGRTSLTLEFAPNQTFFVIFRQSASAATAGKNFPTLQTAQELAGPWQVQFVPKVGKPFDRTFQTLENWALNAEPDIKFFSGTANYRQTFAAQNTDLRFLDLGKVHVMARVKLNGRDLGVVWCDPWRVEIPAGLLRANGNELEISVANLWINRLIGDAGLPKEQRQTWSTLYPYKPDAPLQSSGLLGPVQLLLAK